MPVSKNFELAQLAHGLDVNQATGEVVTINLDTDVVSEGTSNLYFSNTRVDARIALATGSNLDLSQVSVGALSDVDITTSAPQDGQALIWNSANSEFEPGDSFSQTDFDTAFAAKIATDVTFGGNVIFEGATDDAFETTLTATDPTADRTITLQNASGTLAFLSDVTGGASPGNFTTITLDNNITFEGDTDDDHETTLAVVDPTADRTITFPDATGTVALQNASIDMNGTELILDADGDTSITADTDDRIDFKLQGSDQYRMSISSFIPVFSNSMRLGDSGNEWSEVHGVDGHFTSIDFATLSSNPSYSEGLLWYSNVNHTLNYYADDSNVIHELGLEEHQRVYNNTGSTILKGQPLYFSGNYVTGTIDVPTVGLADATDVNKYNAQGIAASDIATGSYGYCLIAGQLHDVDTSALSADKNFFVGLTPGAIQNASPVYPNYPMCLGWVVKSDATTGILLVNQQNHSVNSFRVRTSAHIGSDLQVDGDLTVLGSTTSVSTSDVTAGAPFYRANEGDAIGEAGTTFSGTGLDDAFFSGHFTGIQSTTYYVKIDSVGTPDTFAVSIDNFATTISSNVAITGDKQLIHSADNIYVEFGATTGHTLNDQWTGVAGPVNVDTGFFSNRNTGTSGVGYTHVGIFFDVSDQKWKLVDEYDPTPAGTINTGHASYSEGTLVAGALEGNLDFSYIQNKPDPQITTNLTGTVTGTGSVTLTDLQNGTLNIATTIPGTTNLTLADLIVTNLTVNGTQTINNQTNLTSDDPLFVLNQSQNGEPDIGMIGGYTEASTAQYTGFYRDASDNKWKLFDGYTPNVTSTGSINVNDASFALTTLAAATFEGNLDWSYIQNKPDPVVTVTLTGEVTGTGNATLTDLTSGTISLATTINPNADVEVNDLVVTGDLNVQGTTTTVNQTTLTVTDSKIFLADGNNADVIDIGTIFEYNDGANDQSAGLFRDANDSGKFKFFSTYTPNVTTTIDTGHSSFALGTVVADTFEGNFTGTLTGNISGSADSAAKLTTPRTLWGQSFNGEANVSGNLTSVGNITGTSAIEIIASGTNQNIVTTPSGTGYTLLGGNVGIGNSVPSEKLDVSGNVTIRSTADNGPQLNLRSNDHADAGNFNTEGSINFFADNDADQETLFGQILMATGDIADGAEDGYIYIYNTINGSSVVNAGFGDGNLILHDDDAKIEFWQQGGTNFSINLNAATPSATRTITLPDATGTAITTGNMNSITDIGIQQFTIQLGAGADLQFEGATANSNETTLTVVDPTADRTITLPDATGTVLLQDSTTGLFQINASTAGRNYLTNSGTFNYFLLQNSTSGTGTDDGVLLGVTQAGNALLAQRASNGGTFDFASFDGSGNYAIRAQLGASNLTLSQNMSLVFEGATDDANETTLNVIDPTADRTISLPDADGTVMVRNSSGVVSGGSTNGEMELQGSNPRLRLVDGDSGSDFQIYNSASNTADTYTLEVDYQNNTASSSLRIRIDTEDVAYFDTTGLLLNTGNILRFEGSTADNAETTLTVTDPTQDRTITLPDATGTVALTSDLTSYITLTGLSVGSEGTASGDGAIAYDNSTGVFTYTPPTAAGIGALANVIDDTSPQLGGNLDGQAFNITTTGRLNYKNSYANSSAFPNAGTYNGMFLVDASNGYPYFSHNAGWLRLAQKSETLANVIDDTSPQLGGDLDVLGNAITNSISTATGSGTSYDLLVEKSTSDYVGLRLKNTQNFPGGGGSPYQNFPIRLAFEGKNQGQVSREIAIIFPFHANGTNTSAEKGGLQFTVHNGYSGALANCAEMVPCDNSNAGGIITQGLYVGINPSNTTFPTAGNITIASGGNITFGDGTTQTTAATAGVDSASTYAFIQIFG